MNLTTQPLFALCSVHSAALSVTNSDERKSYLFYISGTVFYVISNGSGCVQASLHCQACTVTVQASVII